MTGGDRLGDKGYYIQPTIFSDVQVSFDCIEVLVQNFSRLLQDMLTVPSKTNKDMFKVHDTAVTGWHEDCSGGDIWACSVNPQVQVSIILMLICLMSETLINNQTIKKCKEILSNNLLGYNFCPA